jgi:proline iminopeptidase
VSSAHDRLIAYRRSLPRSPRLVRTTVQARGLKFAVFSTPAVPDRMPVVCVNGGLLFDHRLLWPALAPLASGRQLIFYDQRGRGESQVPPGVRASKIEHDAGDLPAIREALGLRRWDVLGHSWGGGIAVLAAERDRVAVRRLALVDAVGPTSEWLAPLHDAALARLGHPERAVLAQLRPETLTEPDPDVHSAYSRAFYPAWFADPEMARIFSPPRSNSVTGATIAARLRRDGYDWRALLSGAAAETLVLHGDRDLLPVRVAHALVSFLPNSRLVLVPGSGHMPFWEAPEAFFASVSAFLDAP